MYSQNFPTPLALSRRKRHHDPEPDSDPYPLDLPPDLESREFTETSPPPDAPVEPFSASDLGDSIGPLQERTTDITDTGDFLCFDAGPAVVAEEPWPVIDNLSMLLRGEPPAVAPAVSTATASCRLEPSFQASWETRMSTPLSDFNAVRTHAEQPFERLSPIEPADGPAAGQPHQVFNDQCEIAWNEGGDWVRAFIRSHPDHPSVHRLASGASGGSRCVRWTSRELFDQTESWFNSAQADWTGFQQRGEHHRPCTRTFIIPDHCHRGGGRRIWDLRGVREAQAAGEEISGVPIPHLDPATPIDPSLNIEAFKRLCKKADIQDHYGIQQVSSLGFVSRSLAPRHTVLSMNYPALARHIDFAARKAQAEVQLGRTSKPFSAGIPLFPVRLNPFNAAERPGKDPRLCTDLSSPQADRDGAGRDSVNAGIPFEDSMLFSPLRLTSAQAFCRDLGALLAVTDQGAPPIWAFTADWEAFYRQFPKPTAEWWTQLLWLQPAGPSIDWTTCFGDAAAPTQANRVQDILLALIHDQFTDRLAAFRATASAEQSTALAAIDTGIQARLAALRAR